MKKRLIQALAAALALCLLLTGCSGGGLSGETVSITRHSDTGESDRQYGNTLKASDYDGLYAAVILLVRSRMTRGVIQVSSYPGDVAGDVELICQDVSHNDPFGAYAIYYIASSVTRIVSYYEVEINITYSHTLGQMNAVSAAPNVRYFFSGLTDAVKNCAANYTVSTKDVITPEDIRQYVTNLYYSDPLEVAALPEMEIAVYPDNPAENAERIIEIGFSYPTTALVLKSDLSHLNASVQSLTEESSGETDGEILLSLCRLLCRELDYDDGGYSSAWSALSHGTANSEGYAIAYKALCDRLMLDCQVVLGRLNDEIHAWNIVSLGGEYYHVDISMCDVNGEETAFLLRDADLYEQYWWDTENYPKCAGPLTVFDITGRPEEPEPGEPSPEGEPIPGQENEQETPGGEDAPPSENEP